MDAPVTKDRASLISRRAGIVALGTFSSRVLGALRDSIIAAKFPIHSTDAFWLAFTIPNALRVLFGEGAASGAFVPVLTEASERNQGKPPRESFARLLGTMSALLVPVSLIGVIAAPLIVQLYAFGFTRDAKLFETTVSLTRWVFPYIFLMGVASVIAAGLQTRDYFTSPAFGPSLLNIAMIATTYFLAPYLSAASIPQIYALAFGALLGGILHIAIQIPSLRKSGLLHIARPNLQDPDVKKAFRLLLPLTIALGVYQLNVIMTRLLTSFLPQGSVSYLYYAQRLVEIPQGMFALAVASAALPSLSRAVTRQDYEEASSLFKNALCLNLFIAIPSTISLVVISYPIVSVLFGHGKFDAAAVQQTAAALIGLAGSVWSVSTVRTIVPMFYANQDTRTPIVASAFNVVVFLVASSLLMKPFQHVGLAYAMSIGSIAQLVALYSLLRRRQNLLQFKDIRSNILKMLICSGIMALVLFGLRGLFDWRTTATISMRAISLGILIAAGGATYLICAKLLKMPELLMLRQMVQRKREPARMISTT